MINWFFVKRMIEKGHDVNTIGFMIDAHPETINARVKIEGWKEVFDDEIPSKLLSRKRYESEEDYLDRLGAF